MAVITSKVVQVPERVNFVEWLGFSGEQWADTLHIPTANTRMECEVAILATPGYSGAYKSGGYFAFGVNASYEFYFGNKATTTVAVTTNKVHLVLDGPSKKAEVNGVSYDLSAATFGSTTVSLPIGRLYDGSTAYYYLTMQLYSYKLYESEVLIRDFKPCYDPDGVACLYDLVGETYYYNQGSGEFAAGEPTVGTKYYWQKYAVTAAYETVETTVNEAIDWPSTIYASSALAVSADGAGFTFDKAFSVGEYTTQADSYPYFGLAATASVAYKYSSHTAISIYASKKYTRTASGQTKGDYISTVASTDPNAYPENGIQDGYWYVKVVS